MYLVELRPGKEELYRSVDELAAAIRSGDVDIHSRIFHRATSKWISVTLHPQFKAIAAARDAEPLPPAPRKQWTFLTSAADGLDAGIDSAPPPPVLPEPTVEPRSDEISGSSRWGRPLGLGFAGLLLLLGVQLAFSTPRPRWSRPGAAARPARPAPAGEQSTASVDKAPGVDQAPAVDKAPAVVSLASTATWGGAGYPLPETPASTAPSAARPDAAPPDAVPPDAVPPDAAPPDAAPPADLPRAPAIRLKALGEPLVTRDGGNAKTVDVLIRRYDAAYEAAEARLASGMRAAQLQQLFAPAHLRPSGEVSQLRLSVAGVTNFMRAYRRQETQIERVYQDSFVVASKQFRWSPKQVRQWYARASHKESAEAVALTSTLLGSIDSVLAVLTASAGAYLVAGESITFEERRVAEEYGRLRRRVEQHLALARAHEGASAGVLAALLDAIATTRLPVES